MLYELHVRGHQDWHVGFARSLEMFLNGRGIPVPDPRGQQVTDDSVYPLFSARELVVLQLVERRGGDAEPRRS